MSKIINRYKNSGLTLDKALKTIPLGAQTFSKSITSVPLGVAPLYVENASGCKMWDVDGNEYTDFVNGLACVTLGYCDPDVDHAVREQMKSGITFSLSHKIEAEVSEMIVGMVPCAEMVRFAKNGTDATSGAIRLARAITGKERIAVCGYHGWQDWYIGGTTRNLGVPKSVKKLTHNFKFNDVKSLESILSLWPKEFAAIILEPMNINFPEKGFLEEVRRIASKNGVILVFDETITGFRYSLGGAQELFKVTPDLACFGKGIANGYPLSALVGKREYMELVKEIFFSGSFGGETLSLAAAKAVLTKLQKEPVLAKIKNLGTILMDGVDQLLEENNISYFLTISGHPSWSFLQFKNTKTTTSMELKTLFIQEVVKRGFYTLGTHNISYAHNEDDIQKLLEVYAIVFKKLKEAVELSNVKDQLECEVLTPLFQVR